MKGSRMGAYAITTLPLQHRASWRGNSGIVPRQSLNLKEDIIFCPDANKDFSPPSPLTAASLALTTPFDDEETE
ncbi:hypothetical protein E2C01_060685 [Portunus trituberculatus]|uniref:Uncharacterized protein n=1 Tax=Portunus trituberculatus TaxID=210409 RepID=A0A5B7H9D7_PORTR|nr:hypothetical protein [Portunus trituberculatus]